MAFPSSAIPSPFEAAFRDAVALHQSGDTAAAVARYQNLLENAPDNAELLYLLGGAYVQLSRPRDAIPPLERSIALRGGHVPALDMAGSAWILADDPARAAVYFAQSAALSPASAEHAARFAATLLRCERHAEALAQFKRCLTLEPPHRRALVGAGAAYAHLGQAQEAETILRTCINIHPTYTPAYVTLGTVLGQMERFTDAEAIFARCLAFAPDNSEARHSLAISLQKQGRSDEALAAYQKAHALSPDDPHISTEFGEVLIDLGRLDEARSRLEIAAAAAPLSAKPLTALGRVEELRGNLTAALALHDRAVAAQPDFEGTYINRGTARRFAGDIEGALAVYNKALTLKPGVPQALANRGLTLLSLGRLREGWPDYKMRIRARAGAVDLTGGQPWDGLDLTGKRVLVWTEYGLGDEILFASLLPEVAKAAAHCTFVCSPRLCTLFRRSFPGIDVVALGEPLTGPYDVRVPLTDLAQWLRPSLDSFPTHQGYLKADSALTSELRRRYLKGTRTRLVGLSWRSASGATGLFKTLPLEHWAGILRTPGITFVSLQYGDPHADLDQVRASIGTDIVSDSEIGSGSDLDAFAAQVAAMDLVISVSNTTVHVAGALGIPAWVLVPKGPGTHWYWFRDRKDNPWYPTVRLFRQSEPRQWQKPLAAVARDLAEWRKP